MRETRIESQRQTDARDKRASQLADQVMELDRLRKQKEYPESLHDILKRGLMRETPPTRKELR